MKKLTTCVRALLEKHGGHMEDSTIIDLFWQRDQAAIEETDRKYGNTCRAIANGILSSREDAEECVDDTYMAVWDSIPPQRPEHLSAFLYRIVRNLSFNRLKERYTQKRGGRELDAVLDELEDCVASDLSVERAFETKELVREINGFLFSLSKDDRLIFSYRYWLMLPTAEIAQRLGFRESKVRTSLSRSRKRLRDHLIREGLI